MSNDFLMNFTAAIVAIINPIGLIPLWKELLGDTDRSVRIRVAFMVIGSSMVLLLIFLNLGHHLLQFFQLDLEVFKVAGGILLLFTGISMVDGKVSRLTSRDEKGETSLQIAKQRFRKVLVPLTIPMLAGPGSITTVIIYGGRSQSIMQSAELSLVLLAVLLILLLILCYSHFIEKKLDDLIFVVITRIFGVIVVAIALQFMLEGLAEIFPAWVDGISDIVK